MAKLRGIKDIAESIIEQRELEKIAPSTGFDDLDKCIGGFLPRHLYTLTGKTHTGKTMVACNFADAVRKQGKKVLYIALEPDINVGLSLAAIRLNKKPDEITNDEIRYDDGLIKILIQEDVKNVRELSNIIKSEAINFQLIIVDHIGYFISSTNAVYQEQSNILKILAKIAKDFKTAVMIIAHIRKDAGSYLTMDDISGSASFQQDSTDVLILNRKVDEIDEITVLNEAIISVPKSKYFSKYNYCKILFQPDKLKILANEDIYHE